MKKISRIFIIVLLSTVIALSGFMVIKDLIIQQKEKGEFENLAEITVINQDEIPTSSTAVEVQNNSVSEQAGLQSNNNSGCQIHSIQDLISMNSDCFGWISIPGTNIIYTE